MYLFMTMDLIDCLIRRIYTADKLISHISLKLFAPMAQEEDTTFDNLYLIIRVDF